MAQHDYVLDNASGATFRSDLNDALAAIVSQNSGATAPSTTFAYQWWADTSTSLLKRRNAANTAWVSVMSLTTGLIIGTDVQAYDADTLKADTDDVLAAAFGQGYDALGSLDAMTTDTLTITTIGTSNRKSLTVDVDGTIVVTNMAAGAVLIRATNSGARSLTITGATVTANSAAFDGTASAVNFLLFESDGTTVDLSIDQRG